MFRNTTEYESDNEVHRAKNMSKHSLGLDKSKLNRYSRTSFNNSRYEEFLKEISQIDSDVHRSRNLKHSPQNRPRRSNISFRDIHTRDHSSDRNTIFTNKSPNRSRFGNINLSKIVLGWNLTFNGSSDLSADGFLNKIEVRRKLTRVSDEELLLAMPVFLQGIPSKWFKNHEKEFYSWQKFREEFIPHFNGDDFDRRIKERIQVRT